jgi:hypothetical protein
MNKNRYSKLLPVILINLSGLIILFFFQYMMFAFLPAVKFNTDKIIFRNNVLSFILKKDIIVILETIFGVFILFFFNLRLLKYQRKDSIVIAVLEVIVLVSVTLYFSIGYIYNR